MRATKLRSSAALMSPPLVAFVPVVPVAFMLGRVGLQWAGLNPQMSGGTKMRCVVLTTRLIHNQTLRSQSVGR